MMPGPKSVESPKSEHQCVYFHGPGCPPRIVPFSPRCAGPTPKLWLHCPQTVSMPEKERELDLYNICRIGSGYLFLGFYITKLLIIELHRLAFIAISGLDHGNREFVFVCAMCMMHARWLHSATCICCIPQRVVTQTRARIPPMGTGDGGNSRICWETPWGQMDYGRTSKKSPHGLKMREGGEAGAEMARNPGSQLLLSSSHQVA
jgi:hypothetical protein